MISYIIQFLFSILPDSHCFNLKSFLLRLRGFEIGKNVRIVSSVKIKTKYFSIGDNSFIGYETLIAGGDALIKIGKNVDIAPRCAIISGTHEIGDSTHRADQGVSKEIIIGDGTWIGANTTILAGVTIGNGSIVAAGSLVNDNIESDFLVAGVPARVIRKLP